jgi:hypothetical protein
VKAADAARSSQADRRDPSFSAGRSAYAVQVKGKRRALAYMEMGRPASYVIIPPGEIMKLNLQVSAPSLASVFGRLVNAAGLSDRRGFH